MPGLGAKTARRLYDELGVASLERAAGGRRGRADPRAEGPRAEGRGERPRLARAARRARAPAERLLLSEVLPVAEELAEALRASTRPARRSRSRARRGGWPRPARTSTSSPPPPTRRALAASLATHPLVAAAGKPGAAGTRADDPQRHQGRPADRRRPRRSATCSSTSPARRSTTSSCASGAVKMGLSVSENGIVDTESGEVDTLPRPRPRSTSGSASPTSSPSFARAAARSPRPPKASCPSSSSIEDIRGDLHSHTTLSDGRNSLEEMAEAARERGYAYLAITDHSATPRVRQPRHRRGARRADRGDPRVEPRATRGFRLLAGSEVNIGTDGELDYPDELLEELDWVMASVHTSFRISREAMTERVIDGDREPARRLHRPPHRAPDLLRREPYDIDVEARRRGGGAHRHDARDQRQPQPPRPLRAPRPARGGGRRDRSASTPTPTGSTRSTTCTTAVGDRAAGLAHAPRDRQHARC